MNLITFIENVPRDARPAKPTDEHLQFRDIPPYDSIRLTTAGAPMFTIEHEFDATLITLIDEGEHHLQGDVSINAFADCVTVEQLDSQHRPCP